LKKAKLFMNGQSQAVRLPKEFRFEGDEVFVKRVADGVLLIPATHSWDSMLQSLDMFSPDFMSERAQPETQERQQLD
jgi:antitoxin VapB